MRDFVNKFREIERTLASDRGEFALFALFLREDSTDKWDLIVASKWIDENRKEALSFITQRIAEALSPEELPMLSRVVLVELGNPAVEAVNHAFHITSGVAEVTNSNFFGLEIKHAYIITSHQLNIEEKAPA
jgi:hypothetical protein